MPLASALLIGHVLVFAPTTRAESTAPLPLRKIRLYETGVGYFERHGTVLPTRSLALPLPAAHLDDALKTLVVLEATGGVRVEGVAFPTAVSEGLARAMAGLPDAAGEAVSYADLLHGLEGAAIEVTSKGKRIAGRLVDVEGPFVARIVEAKGEAVAAQTDAEPYYMLLVLGDDDALRRISTRDVEGVKATDRTTASRLDVAAEALTDQTARRVQTLKVHANERGQLGLGYVAESPVWRTTYRIVLADKKSMGELQAWALVHNDTDEHWRDVSIELVNGRPASFLHPLAAPRYARRELVAPADDLSTVPQLANKTVDRMWLDHDVDGNMMGGEVGESYGVGGLGLVGTGHGGGGTGEGTIGLGHVGVVGGLGDLADLAKADATESGALFIYRVTDPIDLDAHHSALVPIVQDDIEVESITFFDAEGNDGQSGVRLVNTTDQTLPVGAVSFFADGGFVGESMLDRLKPKERRFVGYGVELDVELVRRDEKTTEKTTGVRYVDGVLERLFISTRKLVLEVHNRGRRSQRVYAELDVARFAKLEGDGKVELDFDLATNTPLAATSVAAGASVSHRLVAHTAGAEHVVKVDAATLRGLADLAALPRATRDRLRAALAEAERAERFDTSARAYEQAIGVANRDLERIRKDLVAAAGARARAKDKLVHRLEATEKAIDRARIAAAADRLEARRAREQMKEALALLADSPS